MVKRLPLLSLGMSAQEHLALLLIFRQLILILVFAYFFSIFRQQQYHCANQFVYQQSEMECLDNDGLSQVPTKIIS